jgi:chemotaxis protein methyltransferase CheR
MRNATEDIEIQLLLEALYQRYHYDFRHYARASIKRRLKQALAKLEFRSFSALQDGLLHDPTLLPRLLDYLTIQVSEMFRDPSYYRAIREKVDSPFENLSHPSKFGSRAVAAARSFIRS